MNLTPLELAALKNLTTHGFDGPEYWAWCATGGIVSAKATGGVVASLQKKGLVTCQGRGEDAMITITPTGLLALGK